MAVRSRVSLRVMQSTDQISEHSQLLGSSKSPKLYNFNEIPTWQQDNHYILSGYVRETNNIKESLRSLFYLHNESVNVLSHLLPGFVVPLILLLLTPFILNDNQTKLIKAIPEWIDSIPIYPETSQTDEFMFYLFFMGFSTCLSCSAAFHLTKSHSHQICNVGNQLDYVGIIVLIVTSMVSIIYYALYDDSAALKSFLALVLTFGSICLCITLIPQFRESHWRPFRATMFVIFGLSSIFPIAYGLLQFGVKETFDRTGLNWVLLEGAGYCFGAFIYGMRVPERFTPGKYDLFGHSHQIFHVLVVISAFCHFKGLIESYKYAHEHLV